MVQRPEDEITTLLQRWSEGDRTAGDLALDRVYTELRHLAAHYLRQERPDHTLQPTALVHEIYLRLAGKPVEWADRKHFFVVAAGHMRRILVDHARAREAEKRGGPAVRVPLQDADRPDLPRDAELLALDQALEDLNGLDLRAASAVELRFFGGFSESEAAEILGISTATLKRDWEFARAWLLARLH
jgi:RNA polymerase sigma factor (TIGR02999 family)